MRITVVTTLIDEEHTKEEIAERHGFRWHIELDICSIKNSLHYSLEKWSHALQIAGHGWS